MRIEQKFNAVDILVNSQGLTDLATALEVTSAGLVPVITANLARVFTADARYRPEITARSCPRSLMSPRFQPLSARRGLSSREPIGTHRLFRIGM